MNRKKMNRGLGILLSFGMLTSCILPANEFTFAMSAYAEETAVYDVNSDLEISTLDELIAFCDSVNSGETYEGKTVTLTADIDMSDYEGTNKNYWKSIGNDKNPFQGIFDGANHSIKNIYISGEGSLKGFFGLIGKNGHVKNLTIASGSIKGEFKIGAIAGENQGTISNCSNKADVKAFCDVGGIVGANNLGGLVENCHNYGSIFSDENAVESVNSDDMMSGCVGGIAGWSVGHIRNCSNSGSISCSIFDGITTIGRLGGIVGYNGTTIVENCYNTGTVACSNPNFDSVGGIVGEISTLFGGATEGIIRNCYNKGTVSSIGNNVGGIVGYLNSAENQNGNTVKIQYVYNDGNVTGSGANGFSPLVGKNTNSDCSIEAIKGYYDKSKASGANDTLGEGFDKSSEELASQDTFEGWDFDAIWQMDEIIGRPVLIANSESVFTAPTVKKLIFNGEDQVLVNEGNCSVSDMLYSLEEDGKYSTDIPVGKNAGKYTVYYKVVVDGKIIDSQGEEIDYPYLLNVTIDKAELNASMFESIGDQSYIFETELKPKITVNEDYEGAVPEISDYTIKYYNNTEIAAADPDNPENGPYAEITAKANGNFTGSVILPFSIVNNIKPVYEVSIASKSWNSLLDEITFTSYKDADNLEFSVTSGNTDISKAKIEYYISESVMTESELEAFDAWLNYNNTSKPTIEKNKEQIIYVKITDEAGTVTYICSDGIIIDNTAPVVSDVQWNGSTLTFKVDEQGSDYFYLLLPSGDLMPTVDDIIAAAENADGTSISNVGKVTGSNITLNISDLASGTNYNAFVVARDNLYNINETDKETIYHNTSKVASNLKVNIITNYDELNQFRQNVINGNSYENEIVLLEADINMPSTSWESIGNSGNPFNGIFEGNGHIIKNININSMVGNHQGFFGYVGTKGEVKNFGIEGGSISAMDGVGAIVGYNSGKVTNCYSSVTVSGSANAGGVVGINNGIVTNCYSIGTVTIGGTTANSVVGDNKGTVTNCYHLTDTPESGTTGTNGTGKTLEEFKSGEVAWLLQGDYTQQIWGQKAGLDDYPILTDNSSEKVVKVSFIENGSNSSSVYTNPNKTVELPEVKSENSNYEFLKWSTSDTLGGEEFTNETIVTEDTMVYAVFSEKAIIQDNRNISVNYGTVKSQDLSKYITYAGKTKTDDKFTYEIESGNDDLGAAISANNLSIPNNAPAGEYDLVIIATEKPSINKVDSVGLVEYGTKNIVLEVKVTISKVNLKITAPKSIKLYYNGSEQKLVSEGSSPDGTTITFSITQNGEYTSEIPTGINAGSYIVYYKVDGGDNYNDIPPTLINGVAISKAKPNVIPPVANTLTYDGKEHELFKLGSTDGGTLEYTFDKITYDTKVLTGKNAAQYTVYYRVVGNNNYSDIADKSIRVTIAKATPEVTPPTPKEGLVYNGKEQELINPGKTNGGEMRYSLNGKDWSAEIPKGLDAKKYVVSYRVIDDEKNYSDTQSSKFDVEIKKATSEVVPPKANELTYNGSELQLITPGSSNSGDMLYSLDGKNYTADIPTGIDAGTYTVHYKVENNSNYENVDAASIEVTINKAMPKVVAPTSKKLTYSGSAQELIIAGSTSNGEMQYRLENGKYSTDLPTAINAGTYTVYYKVVGDGNYSDVEEQSIEVTITKALPKVVAPVAKDNLVSDGSSQELIIAGSTDAGKMSYSLDEDGEYSAAIPTATEAGSYSVYYKVDGDSNYEVITGKVDVEVKGKQITSVSTTSSTATTTSSVTTVSQNTTTTSDATSSSASTVTSNVSSSSVSTATSNVSSSSVSTATSNVSSSSASTATSYVSSSSISTATSYVSSSSVSTATSDVSSSSISTATSDVSSSNVSTATSYVTSSEVSTSTSDVTSSEVSTSTSDVTSSEVSTSTSDVTSSEVSSDTSVSSSEVSSNISVTSSEVSSDTSVSSSEVSSDTSVSSSVSGSEISTSSSVSSDTTSVSTTAVTTTTAPVVTKYVLLGDADSNDKVDILDAAYIARKVAQRKTNELPFYADFNQDGVCNIVDAAAIARVIAKRDTKHWIHVVIIIRQ